MTTRPPAVAALVCGLALVTGLARAGILYRTDFENFTAGDDHWVGTDGWTGNSIGVGAHGIDQDIIAGGGLGRTGFIGYNQPASTFVYVARPIHYTPGPGDLPVVEVETIIGIQDSLNKSARDSFFASVYNSNGDFLAGVRFCNATASFGIWREDGVSATDTGASFYRGELHLLQLRIDLAANRWSAQFLEGEGVPLFENQPFTATGLPVNFGYLAYEWQLTAASASGYGDNWMLVADAVVRSVPRGIVPFRVSSFVRGPTTATLTWPAENGFDYHVEHSTDQLNWFQDLPGAAFPGITSDLTLSYTGSCPPGQCFYRVVRSETP